jgi:hypothetical protein
MKIYAGVKVYAPIFLISALDGCEWSATCTCCFSPGESARHPLDRRLSGPQSRPGRWVQIYIYICQYKKPGQLNSYSDGRGSISGSGKIFLLSKASKPALWYTKPPIQWVIGTLSPGVKRQKREADRSPLASAEVKNGGAILPFQHVFMAWYLIKHKDNSTLF